MATPSSDYGAGLATTAQNTGSNAITSYDPTSSANSVKSGYNSLFGSQVGSGPQNSTDYMKAYAASVAGNPSVTKLYNEGNDMFNVPTLMSNANRLNNAVLQAPQQNVDLSKGFDVSQGQIDSKTNQDLARLSPLAAAANNNAQTAETLAGGYVNAGQAQNAQNLLPIQAYGGQLNDSMARQSTGFDIASQNELQGLIAKMNAGVTLSQAEMDRANSLAAQETSYQNAITGANASQNVAKIGAQNIKLGQGDTYYNPSTGVAYNPFATPATP